MEGNTSHRMNLPRMLTKQGNTIEIGNHSKRVTPQYTFLQNVVILVFPSLSLVNCIWECFICFQNVFQRKWMLALIPVLLQVVCPWENQAEPGRRWYSSNHLFCSNLAQMLGLVSKWSWQNLRLKYFILFKLRGPPPKMALLSLIYAYLISCLWFSISTTRKAMWKWNPLDHVLLLLVTKHRYSFEPDNLISLRGSILSKVHIL